MRENIVIMREISSKREMLGKILFFRGKTLIELKYFCIENKTQTKKERSNL